MPSRLRRILGKLWRDLVGPAAPPAKTAGWAGGNRRQSTSVYGRTVISSAKDKKKQVQDCSDQIRKGLEPYEAAVREIGATKNAAERAKRLAEATQNLHHLPLGERLETNLEVLRYLFAGASDWIVRRFSLPGGVDAALVHIDGLIKGNVIGQLALKPLLYDAFGLSDGEKLGRDFDTMEQRVVPIMETKMAATVKDAVDAVVGGDTALFVDGDCRALLLSERGYEHRSVSEPATESVIRGPREGFVEVLRTNTSLLRRRLKTPQLKMEALQVGTLSNTDIVVTYLEGIAAESIVTEVKDRISQIDIDGIVASAYIEELIEDDLYSPFPQILTTERPDTVAAHFLEGRVAILTDGTPFALVVPITFGA